jgi:hypothetical protein
MPGSECSSGLVRRVVRGVCVFEFARDVEELGPDTDRWAIDELPRSRDPDQKEDDYERRDLPLSLRLIG